MILTPGSLVVKNTSGADRTMTAYNDYVFVDGSSIELVANAAIDKMCATDFFQARAMLREPTCELAIMRAAGHLEIVSYERPTWVETE
jgi:hypothetical protein